MGFRGVVLAAVAAGAVLGAPAPAAACTCRSGPKPPEEVIALGRLVARGEVVAAAVAERTLGEGASALVMRVGRYRVRIDGAINGVLPAEIEVETDLSTSCRTGLPQGRSFTMVLGGGPDVWSVDFCSQILIGGEAEWDPFFAAPR